MDVCQQPQLPNDPVVSVEEKFQTLLLPSLEDFDAWTSFIAETEKKYPDDIEKICLVYEPFLSEFPLCYGYWKKYASLKARLCSVDKVVEVYERAVQFATYSVDLWVDYCNFGMLLFEDPTDVRRLFERGISYVGKDYLCHRLWDKYIEFEYSQKQWSSLAHIYIRTLKFPTRKLHRYYDSIKKLAAILEEEIEFQGSGATGLESDVACNNGMSDEVPYEDEEISIVIRDLLDPVVGLPKSNALQRYLSTGEQFYEKASLMDVKVLCFENGIRRPYFHAKPLDINQLENWHQYLDFIETQEDFDLTVKLYERCLIPCANYPEFWIRYAELMETKGGREIANFALHRATTVFLKRVPEIHLFCARFKEKIGDALGSRAAFRQCDSEIDSEFIENVKREANMEKRMGNSEAASNIYEKALSLAKEKHKLQTLSILHVEFSRFKYMLTGSVDAARGVLLEGIQHLPHCKLLIEEFMNFETRHREPKNMNTVDSIVAYATSAALDVSQGLSNKDREDISILYLEFVDQFGTIHDIMKAWNRHTKLFPHLLRPSSCNHTTRRQEMLMVVPHHATGDDNSYGPHEPSELDKKDQNLAQRENPAIQPDHAVSIESQSEDIKGLKETLERVECPNVVEQSDKDLTEPNIEANSFEHMDTNGCEAPEVADDCQEYMGEAKEVQKMTHEPTENLRPPSLENLSLNSEDNETRVSNPAIECHLETSRSNGSRLHDGVHNHEATYVSSQTCMQSDGSPQAHGRTEYGASCMSESSNSLPHMQSSGHAVISSNNSAVSGGILHQMNYVGQVSGDARSGFSGHLQTQPQQLQSSQPLHQSSSMNSQMYIGPSYPYQSQSLPHQQMQLGNQAPNQFQDTPAEVQPISAHPWPVQNMQQTSFTPPSQLQTVSLPVSYPQGQVYQYAMQSNVQYGHMQANQGYGPHIWQYYYQQQQQQQPQPQLQPQPQPQQQQQQQQQMQTYMQIQSWNSNYYQQRAPMQQFGSSPYGQEYGQHTVGSQGQGAPPIIETSGNSVHSYPQPNPPSS